MPISLSCPQCGKLYQLSDGLAGKKGRCKVCGSVFQIPAAKVTAAAPLAADLFAGLDDGEAVVRSTPSRSSSSKFGPFPTAEEESVPNPRVSKSKRRVKVDQELQEGFRRSGISMIVFGSLAFALPMVGLQWRLLNFMPPAVQEFIGGALFLAGVGGVALSFTPRPSKVLGMGALAIFGIIAAAVGFVMVPQWMAMGEPPANPPHPGFVPPQARPFVQPPANFPNPAVPPPTMEPREGTVDETLYNLSNAQAARESGPGVLIRELMFRVDYQSTGKQAIGAQLFWVVESSQTNANRRMIGVDPRNGILSGSITVTDGDTGPFKTYIVREAFGPGGRSRVKVSNVVDMQWMGERAANESMIPNASVQPPANDPTNAPPTGPRRGFPGMPGRPGFPRRPGMP